MRILGIDPGLATTGFGCLETNGQQHQLIDAGVIQTPAGQPEPQRLATIYSELVQIIDQSKPTVASVERLFFARNVTTALAVSQAKGVILLALQQANLDIVEYTPLQVKSSLIGYGRATKAQIQEAVKNVLKLEKRPTPDDCADALALALTHASQI